MAVPIKSHQDFRTKQALNLVIHPAAAAPTTYNPVGGQVYFNTQSGDKRIYVYDDQITSWVKVPRLDRAETASGLWTFSAQIAFTNATVPFTVQSGTNTVTNLSADKLDGYDSDKSSAGNTVAVRNSDGTLTAADPTASTHLATKNYVDSVGQGLFIKDPCRMATTANITLSGLQTIDGVAGNADDRVLVKDQTTASQNGIWLQKSGAWVRATDSDSSAEVDAGMYTYITEGATNIGKSYVQTVNNPTLGTTGLSFSLFYQAVAYTAGNGIGLSGVQIYFKVAGSSTYTANTILYTSSTSAIGSLGPLANGQLLIGSSGAAPVVASLTGTANQITVTPGAGAITLTTPQDIHTGATPTFSTLSLSATSNQIILQSAGVTGTLTWTPASSNKTITLPNITGTVMLTNGGQTVSSAVWNGTTIATGYGGTGLTTYTTGDLIYASATNTLLQLAFGAANTVLRTGSGSVPSWGQVVNADIANSTIDLTTKVTGVLPVANGGTGRTSWTAGCIVYNSSASTLDNTTVLQFDDVNRRLGVGRMGNSGVPDYTITLDYSVACVISPARMITSNVDGYSLTVKAQGGKTTSTDRNGGNLILQSGETTGTGTASILFQTMTPGTSGASDNTYATKVSIDSYGKLTTYATAAASAGFNLPHGTAPTSPVNGDVWTTTAGGYMRINGTTYQICSTSGSVFGTGTTGTLTKWTGSGTIGDSIVSESGTTLTVANVVNAVTGFRINGAATSNTILLGNGTNYVSSAAATLTAGTGLSGTTSNALITAATLSIDQTFSPTWTGFHTFKTGAMGTTPDDTKGVLLSNTTAAAAGAQQISPAIRWAGLGWKTNSTAASQAVTFRAYVVPVQGTANPTGYWTLEHSINGGSYSEDCRVTSAGVLSVTTGFQIGGAAASTAILMGNGTNFVATTLTGVAVTSITGTANQVIASASTGAITLSTPQDIGTGSNVVFNRLGLGRTSNAPSVMLHLGLGQASGVQGYIRLENSGAASKEANIYNDTTNGGLHIDTNGNAYPIQLDGSQVCFKGYTTTVTGTQQIFTTSLIGVNTTNDYGGCMFLSPTDANTANPTVGSIFLTSRDRTNSAMTSALVITCITAGVAGKNILLNPYSAGNIGMGLDAPAYKLDVSGIINASSGFKYNATATSGQYLRANGTAFVGSAILAADLPGSFSGFANPSASIGLTAVNGSATTAMRSDAAPALDQSIAPTWTGQHTFNSNSVIIGGANLSTAANFSIGSLQSTFTVSKNDSNAKTFYGLKQLVNVNCGATNTTTTINNVYSTATLNPTNGNASTTVNLFYCDTTNTQTYGLTVNLLNLNYGGSNIFTMDSGGACTLNTTATTAFNVVQTAGSTAFNVSFTKSVSGGLTGFYAQMIGDYNGSSAIIPFRAGVSVNASKAYSTTYGFLIDATSVLGTVTTAYGIYINAQKTSGVTTGYGIYQVDSADFNQFVGKTRFGPAGTPTAYLHLSAGTATASTAPLKFTSGTNLTTAEAGAIEYDGSWFYATPQTSAGRQTLALGKAFTITGDGATQSWNIDHNLNTRNVVVMVRENNISSSYKCVACEAEPTTVNRVVIRMDEIPATGEDHVVVVLAVA